MFISVFTPTYNRRDTLERLYESLKEQTFKDFQWVIVDDGSTDDTKEYLKKIKKENILNITYISKENGGKMRAINEGIALSKGEFFFIVDSDDYLTLDALEKIYKKGKNLPRELGGLVFRKINISTGKITGKRFKEEIVSTPIDIFYNLKIDGDKSEVIRTSIMREFPFEVFQGEKFLPEGYIWNRIGEKYKLLYVDEGIYYYEYLESGYTNSFKKLMKNNPRGFNIYYKYMLKQRIPLLNRVKFIIRYLESCFYILKGGKK
ncbi:MAG: glycosyltransferase family 2 protein [Cetobacterium sp.]|nr:glycosyltransferase family 2 protein [Cetobacterium sp.]